MKFIFTATMILLVSQLKAQEPRQKIELSEELYKKLNADTKIALSGVENLYLVKSYPLQADFYPFADKLSDSPDEPLKVLTEWNNYLSQETNERVVTQGLKFGTYYLAKKKELAGLKYIYSTFANLIHLANGENEEVAKAALSVLRKLEPTTKTPQSAEWFKNDFLNKKGYLAILKAASKDKLISQQEARK